MAGTTGIVNYSTHMRQKGSRAKTLEATLETARSADASRSGGTRRRLGRVGLSKKTCRGAEVVDILGVRSASVYNWKTLQRHRLLLGELWKMIEGEW